jgi:long-chain acyl-CoA synthetase
METIGSFVETAVRRFRQRPALLYRPLYRTESWTYARLWEESGRVIRRLREQGLERGDRVVIWAPNSPWWVAAYCGCLRLGLILVPLDMRSTPAFIERVVAQTAPKLAILSRLTRDAWRYPGATWMLEDLAGLLAHYATDAPGTVAASDIAEVMFTSGTTGDPKGVILTHGNITANVASALQVMPGRSDHRLLSLLPLSHMFEQTVGLLLPLGCGSSVYYPASRQSTMLFRDLQTQEITTMLAVPQAFQLLMAAIEREVARAGKEAAWQRLARVAPRLPFAARRLLFHRVHRQLGGKLQLLVSGGAPLEAELVRKWETLGLPIIQGYGATEAAPIISVTTLHDLGPGTVGRPVPGVALRLADDGEVLVHGANITPGYWQNARATAEAVSDGWYRTGDLGQLDVEGRLVLRGRKKDMIVLANGQNVFPMDVENAFREAGGLRDVVVLGMPSASGAQVYAVLLPGPVQLDAHAVVQAANARLAPHQQVQGFTVWPEADFPRTHTMKVKQQEVLRTVLARRELAERSPVPPIQAARDTTAVRRLIAEAAGKQDAALSDAATLGSDCGLDSLARVELLASIESELGVYLDETRVHEDTTVAELEALVAVQESSSRPVFPRWPLGLAARLLRAALQVPAFGLLNGIAPATVSGLESLHGVTPPVLFAANHASHLDSPVLLRALPHAWRQRLAVAAAADYFFTRRLMGQSVALTLNAFPFSREGNIRPTIEHSAWLLDHGWSILIFPEGTRSTTGEMAPFKTGSGLLAVDLQVPVVPVRLAGLRVVLPKGQVVPRRSHVTVHFGPALRFAPGTPYAEATLAIEAAVHALEA